MGALPVAVRWTPQQLADAMVSRMSLVTAQTFALFVTGSTAPTSDVGPWLKNGVEWWVWDSGTGSYVPITIGSASLGYWVGSDAPDPAVYSFWIETAVGGSPTALKIFYSGAWTDVYAATLAGYATTAAMNAAIAAAVAPYLLAATAAATYLTIATAASTYAPLASPALTGTPTVPTAAPGTNTTQSASTAFVAAAIAAIPSPSAFAAYPAQATRTSQVINADGTPDQIDLDTAVFNPAPAPFNTGTFRYVAPAAGYYEVSATTQFDNGTATAASMEIEVALYKNGSPTGISDLDSTPSPNGSRWSPGFTSLVLLAVNDYLELFADVDDGVGAGNVTCSARLSVHRVQA